MPTYEYIQGVVNRPPRPRSERLRKLGAIVSTSATVGSPAGYYSGEGHSHQNLAALNMITVDDGYIYLTDAVIDPDTQESAIETTKVKAGYADMALTNADGHTLDWFLPVVVDGEWTLQLNPVYVGLWANGWMTSGGVGNGSSGSSGGVDLDRLWQSLTNNTDKPDIKINLAHIPNLTTSKISNLEGWIAGKGYVTASAIPSTLAQLSDDTTHRLVTDTQIIAWNNKVSNVQADWNATTGLAAILNKPSLSAVATSGSYNDLSNKPGIPNENTVSGWGFTKAAGTVTSVGLSVPAGLSVSGSPVTASGTLTISFANGYSIPTTAKQVAWDSKYDKPSTGIPKTDLAQAVQTSLGKADTALQSFSETDPVYSAWAGTIRTKNTVFAAPSSANGTPSFRELAVSDIPSISMSKISDAESWITAKGYALNSDLTTLAGRVTSIEDWFEVVTVDGQAALHLKQGRALYSDLWITSGGIGSGSSGGGSVVAWGTKSGYTRPLTVEGFTETLLLDGALSGYATTSALTSGLATKQDKYAFTLQGTSGVTYNLANALYGAVISNGADIGTTLTTIATVAGVDIRAKITHQSLAGYATQSWVQQRGYLTASALNGYALVDGDPDYDFEVGSLIIGDGALTIGSDYRPVWQFPGTDPSTMPPTSITVAKNLAYLDEVVLLSGQQTISGTKSFRNSISGGTSLQSNKWSITNAGAATFASLTVGGNSVVPADYVTLTGAQTISGAKTFSAGLTLSNNVAVRGLDTGGTDRELLKLANNDWLYIGNNGITSVQLNATGYIKMYWDSGDAYASFGAGASAYFPNLLPNGTSGTKNLGSSSARWNGICGATLDLSGGITLGGSILPKSDSSVNFGDSQHRFAGGNVRNLYVTNQTFVDGTTPSITYGAIYYGNGLMQLQLGANAAGGFLTFGQATGFFHNGDGGIPLGRSDHRWSCIYGVDASFSGNLSLSQTSHIDIGEGRIEYDDQNHAFRFTRASGNNEVGVYAYGCVASGGIGSGDAGVKYVTCTQEEYNAMTKAPATLYLIGSPISKVCLGSITLYTEN